jgi:hypothetical protein
MQTIQLPDEIYSRLKQAAEAEFREPAGQIAYLVNKHLGPVEASQEKRTTHRDPPPRYSVMYQALVACASLEDTQHGDGFTEEDLDKALKLGKSKSGRSRAAGNIGNLIYRGMLTRTGPRGGHIYKVSTAGRAWINGENDAKS